MGWTSGFASVSEIKRDLNANRGSLEIVKQVSTSYGRHLWTVYKVPNGNTFIHLDLIEKCGDSYGYKPMSEDMGPCYYDCPLSVLEAAGPSSREDTNEWRAKVRAFHAKTKVDYKPGDEVMIFGKRYAVVAPEKRSFLVRSVDSGRLFKASPTKMSRATIPLALENLG